MRGGPLVVVVVVALLWLLVTVVSGATNPNDLKILSEFRQGLKNPELLKWPDNGDDPCGPPSWPHVFCSRDRVSQIQVQGLGLEGPLPQSFNELSKLSNLGLQRNKLSGKLPTFSGLSELEFAYLDYNEFDSIPSDFFEGLTSIRVLALDYNDLNKTHGWSIPDSLSKSVQLANLSLMSTNLVGPLPGFLGELPSLAAVKLSYNRLSGEIPVSFGQSLVQILWLNNQLEGGGGMSGSIDVVGSMAMLTQLWLHGNRFSGKIPETIGGLSSLRELNLNGNDLVGLIPDSLANMELQNLVLDNNRFMGPIPKFNAVNVSYDSNFFCQVKPGLQCAPQVTALLGFLDDLDYPENLAPQWSGNDPCDGPWLGFSCNSKSEVSILNLPRRNLTGSFSPLIAELGSLLEIRLGGNNLNGTIPMNLTELNSLRLLDLSGNNFEPPLPKFRDNVKVVIGGNPLLVSNRTISSPPPLSISSPPPISKPSPESPTHSQTSPPSPLTSSPRSSSTPAQRQPPPTSSKRLMIIAGGAVAFAILVVLVALLLICCRKKRKGNVQDPSSIVVHPKDPSDPDNIIKFAVTSKSSGGLSNQTRSEYSNRTENSQSIESGNLIISVQVLRKVTKDFAPENELGRGGFGVVYKGELEDGTKIAVKRMEGGVMCNKAVDEFQSEIAVLSKVRHRHLVSLIGYSVEGNERLLVYEYMSQGALSKRLFHWDSLKLEPLSWTKRLSIALDVARGVEYLHNLARETFIHRDLKSSNILLGDDFRAKVSDFGLVKLAPDGDKSVATRLAGTFGYLAPEYAVMGKITTKTDVFSYGVVLMELLTGLIALDEDRSEERRYLAEWFWRIKSSKETLMGAIDPALEVNQDTVEGILVIAELAGHCTARDPNHRPDMGHAVSVLSPLVEKWKPVSKEVESFSGIDYTLPLPQMLKDWQEAESRGLSYTSVTDSKGSIPAKPTGFADSFTSADGR